MNLVLGVFFTEEGRVEDLGKATDKMCQRSILSFPWLCDTTRVSPLDRGTTTLL